MRHILCKSCGEKLNGFGRETPRMIYPANSEGPAEYERIVSGIAKLPTAGQRVMTISTQPIPLKPGYYNCDTCNTPIPPGSPAVARTVWVADREPGPWEHEFLDLAPDLDLPR